LDTYKSQETVNLEIWKNSLRDLTKDLLSFGGWVVYFFRFISLEIKERMGERGRTSQAFKGLIKYNMEIIKRESDFNSVSEPIQLKIEVKKTDAPHERADLINQFVEKINETTKPPHEPVTFKKINGQLKKLKEGDLYRLLKECEQGKNFGALFWWRLKKIRLEVFSKK